VKKFLGILGGMGPRASAEFLSTIYDLCADPEEQAFPGCILHSDPSIPDRTAAILNGEETLVLQHLTRALEMLCHAPVDRIVIACVTSHYFVPKLPAPLREKVISLTGIIFDEVMNTKRRHLLLCSNGVRQVRLFENDERWKLIQPWIVFPDQKDQRLIHDFIYRIKTDAFDESVLVTLKSFISRYEVDSFVAGCTELHGLAMRLRTMADPSCNFIDPLFSIAQNIKQYL
jgi:aspartate racemase